MARVRSLLGLAAFALFALGVLLWARPSVADEPATDFVVIVNADNPYYTLERSFIADAFLKKTTRWPNGDVIRPVDLAPDAPVRERFSQAILKRSVGAVKSYWQQMIFSGRDIPPPELARDEDVIKYVTTHPRAIGYVSPKTALTGIRPVVVR